MISLVSSYDDGDQVATLRLTSVTRHTGGQYICTADNGGEAVTSAVRLHVEFAPEIHVDRLLERILLEKNIYCSSRSVIVTSLGAEEDVRSTVIRHF